MSSLRSLVLSVMLPGFTGTTVPPWLARRVQEGLAGACLFGQNVAGPREVRALTDELHGLRPGVLVASDEEGGTVTRLEHRTGSSWPGHATLGVLDDPDTTYQVAAALGAQACRAGVDIVLAPVVDVNSDPENPVIGVRSFGDSPELVARHGAAFVRGLQDAGVAACAKHFPGHGATRVDSHLELPVLDVAADVLRARDLPPFVAVVNAGVRCVMTAHVVVRALDDRPATMSPPVLRILRDEIGFDGVVLTDALDMRAVTGGVGLAEGAVQALAAGADLLCLGNPAFPEPYDEVDALERVAAAVTDAVSSGRVPQERLEEAAARVARLAVSMGPPVMSAPAGEDDAALGLAAARRALRVRGDVSVRGEALLVVPRADVALAAGRRESGLVAALTQRRPAWPVAELRDESGLPGVAGRGDVVIVVEGRFDAAVQHTVGAVLRQRPDAIVVYGGVADGTEPGARAVYTYGGGRAAGQALADLLMAGER